MATKKEKRAAALAKREEFLAGVRADGLEAQALGRAQEAYERELIRESIQTINDRHREILARHGIHE